jgi:hypothetical protein
MSADEWTALLDRLEEDAGRILDADPGAAEAEIVRSWTPPAAPLPPHLADRAQRVIALQRAAMSRARAELDDLRPHLEAVRRIPADAHDAPAYLDTNG